MMKLNLLSFQLFVKERAVKLQVDIVCDGDYGTCSVKLNRLDWYTLTSWRWRESKSCVFVLSETRKTCYPT